MKERNIGKRVNNREKKGTHIEGSVVLFLLTTRRFVLELFLATLATLGQLFVALPVDDEQDVGLERGDAVVDRVGVEDDSLLEPAVER